VKRTTAIGAVLVALAIPAAAQAQVFELIILGGATFGTYSGDNITSSSQVGGQGGAKVRFGGPFYGDVGVLFGGNGGKITETASGTTGEVLTTNVRVPATFGVRVIRAKVFDVRFFLGGVFDIVSSVADNPFDIVKDDVKSSVFNGRVGAGLDVFILAFDLAYEFGLSDVFEESAGLGSVKRNGWAAEVGLRFAF
jgi:hypothetical protein